MGPVDMDNLVDAHGNAVYRFCVRLTGSRGEAEELFQQTFLRAVELENRIDPARNPLGFLLAIAAGAHRRNRGKAARRQRILPVEEGGADPDALPGSGDLQTEAGQMELRRTVRAIVRGLPEKYRTPVAMLYAGGLSVAEIAVATGLRQGTVKSRLHKARQLIRTELEAKGYGREEA